MDSIRTVPEQYTESFPCCAVAIGDGGGGRLHLGILHTPKGQPTQFLHLAWHCRLRNTTPPPHYLSLWACPELSESGRRLVVAKCGQILRANAKNGIPYGFSSPEHALDPETGAFLFSGTRYGLTCATFVLAVYGAVGIRLAAYATWPSARPGDDEWQTEVLDQLREDGEADADHLAKVQSDIGSVRFRPEEVFAAAAQAPPACGFEQAKLLGAAIRAQLIAA